MKKILLALASAVMITSSAVGVVSCGFREPANVILELMQNIAKPNSPILKAYRDIVDDYNRDRPDNPIKVEVRETPANNIDNEIATGQPLPSLYVSYGDTSTKYETILNQIDENDKVVDMAQVVNWNLNYASNINEQEEPQIAFIKNFSENATKGNELTKGKPLDEITHVDVDEEDPLYDELHFTPLRDSFPREGSNNQKMYVVPTAKSGMNGVMNTRLINELVGIVSNNAIDLKAQIPEANIRDPFFFKNASITQWIGEKDVPLKNLESRWQLPLLNNYRDSDKKIAELFQEWFQGVNSVSKLQDVMQDLSKLEVVVLAYNLLVEYGGNRNYFKSHFSVAFDDVPGLLYTMQANLGLGDQQIYSWESEKPYTLNLFENGNPVKALQAIIELFAWADKIRPLDNDAGNNPDHGYGGLTAKLNSGMYYSDTWQKQGMLAYFGSTAGAAYWVKENPDGEDAFVQVQDLQLMSAPTYKQEGETSQNFVAQQGPGMGMFKSKNQIKNEIAIDFVNYFLKAENNTKFAIAAGYIPSNYYAYYAEKGKTGVPGNESEMGPFYKKLFEESQKEKPTEIKSAPVLIKYVDSILNDETQLWTQIPTPFGDAVRFQILVPWFEANFKTIQGHRLDFAEFWKDLKNQRSIASVWRVVHGIFPVEGKYTIT